MSTDAPLVPVVDSEPADSLPLEPPLPPQAKGRFFRLPRSRRLITDLLYFAKKLPSQPLVRHCNIAPLLEARRNSADRIGWAAIFMKAYGLLSAERAELRQTYMRYPLPYVYEHPFSIARMTVLREYRGEEWVFFAQFPQPELLSLAELQRLIVSVKTTPVESITKFRQQLIFSRFPTALRRLAWWTVLSLYGPRKINRFGTFGMTTVSAAGAISIHPPGIQANTLTFGPVSEAGDVRITIVYDHRLMDGMTIAECLARLEEILNGPIADELRGG